MAADEGDLVVRGDASSPCPCPCCDHNPGCVKTTKKVGSAMGSDGCQRPRTVWRDWHQTGARVDGVDEAGNEDGHGP